MVSRRTPPLFCLGSRVSREVSVLTRAPGILFFVICMAGGEADLQPRRHGLRRSHAHRIILHVRRLLLFCGLVVSDLIDLSGCALAC
jgi:hypothetical protein